MGADASPLAEQGGAAEEIVLEAQPVEAPAIGCRHDVPQLGRLGEEGQLTQGARRGRMGRFGHVYPRNVTGRATRYQGKEARRAVFPGAGAARAVLPVTLLPIMYQLIRSVDLGRVTILSLCQTLMMLQRSGPNLHDMRNLTKQISTNLGTVHTVISKVAIMAIYVFYRWELNTL